MTTQNIKEELNKDMVNLREKNQIGILEIKVPLVKQKTQQKASPADSNKWKTESQKSKIKQKLKEKNRRNLSQTTQEL
jgi:hypothetical protein